MKEKTHEKRKKRRKEKPSSAAITNGVERPPAETVEHPLASLAGKFTGEEWEALLEAIRYNRRAIDA